MRNDVGMWALVLLLVALSVGAAEAPNLLRNPGFEDAEKALPVAWDWGIGKEAKATLAIDTAVRRSGAASLRLATASPLAPHVYGTLCQRVVGLQPRRVYAVTFWAKGEEVGACWFGGGSDWTQRIMFPTGRFDWRPVSGEVVTGADETYFDLRLNVDAVTQALWIDDVSLRLVGSLIPNGVVTAVADAQLAAARFYPAPRVADGSLMLDGDLADWERVPASRLHLNGTVARLSYTGYGGPSDLSADVRLAYDAEALYLAIEVSDDVFFQPVGGVSAWWYDSVQVAFDPQGDRAGGAYAGDDVEIGSNTAIDRATFGVTKLGNGVKIDNLVQIGHNVQIGAHSVIAGMAGVAGSTVIGTQVRIGASAGINGHITIGDGASIAARSGVTRSVAPGQVVSGFPAMDHAQQRRVMVVQAQLPELAKRVRQLEARLAALEDNKEL